MDGVTKLVSAYVADRGINIAKMARDTGIPYISLYRSLSQNEGNRRPIRGSELLRICAFLGVPAEYFGEKKESA